MTIYRALCSELIQQLQELHIMVWGEAPHLLDEDRGGSAYLDLNIEDVLEKARAALAEPEPPADGEVAELVAELKLMASDASAASQTSDAKILAIAADLLERLAEPEPDGPAVPAGREPASVAPEVTGPRPLSPAAAALVAAFDDRYENCGPFDGNWQEVCLAAVLRHLAAAHGGPWSFGAVRLELLERQAAELEGMD
jgi:hypothetical protein